MQSQDYKNSLSLEYVTLFQQAEGVGLAVDGGEGEEGGGLGASVYQFQGKSPRMQLREVLPYL